MKVTKIALHAAVAAVIGGCSSAALAACPPGQQQCPPPKGGGGGGLGPPTTQQGGSQTAGMIAGRVSQAVGGVLGNMGGMRGGGGGGGPAAPGGAPAGGGNAPAAAPGQTGMSESDESVGMAAGSAPVKYGAWVSGSNTWMSGDQKSNDYFARIQSALVGFDATIDGKYIVGLSLGTEKDWTRIKYTGVEISGHGVTVSPYLAYIINQYLYVDGSFGVSRMLYDEQSYTQHGDYNGLRKFAGANLNAGSAFGSWYASTSLGYLYSTEDQSAYRTSSNSDVDTSQNRTGQVRSTTKLGYTELTNWGWIFPYASARLEYDANKTGALVVDTTTGERAANSRFGTTFGLGSSIGIGSNTTLTLEGTTTEFREHTDIYAVSGTMRLTF